MLHQGKASSRIRPENLQESVSVSNGVAKIDAADMHYRELNANLRALNGNGVKQIELRNVYGQRYIGTNLKENTNVDIYGIPGNDLGAFMRGPIITVHGDAQDGCGNTMDEGKIIIHGHAGDILGYAMRGGSIFVRDDVGYRVGIHMKEYRRKKPVIVVGGTAQDFLGEYMAGGILVVLGLTLKDGERHRARFVGTGMHGGKMYVRGEFSHPAKDVKVVGLDAEDREVLLGIVSEFCDYFGYDINEIMAHEFNKVVPISHRPYNNVYAK
jgi:glutamate synthase domain-containing protein 3